MKNFLAELTWRGLVEDQTPGFAERLLQGPITGYVGFDPTARSLQLGNLVPVMLLTHLQRAGGKPLVVVGGGTGMIGDPSGRRAERPLLDTAVIEENVARQTQQFARFLDLAPGARGAQIVNNADWLGPLPLVTFLRDVGKHFTLSYMLQKESVKSRLEDGISYTEFSYMLLQAYDFLQLYRTHGCELQLGGSDQWGNITAGRELVRRVEGVEVHGLCAPLLTNPSGAKFGKSEGGNVWLDGELTSPYRFYQFWINADDQDVPSHLRVFSLRTRDEIADLLAQHEASPGARVPHQALAREMTERVHGTDNAERVVNASRILFGELDPRAAGPGTWQVLAAELPSTEIDLATPKSAVELATLSGLCKSNGEARRLIAQRGISLNGQPLTEEMTAGPDDVLQGGYLWLRRGKKHDAILVTAGR
ncbi:MAG: tyrosine--tRNA ligase [Gemmatimonadales bacterium]|jgi:tyrosyl-tRNA synthetase|nr:tyrosine--tRNA ligase [Gemmatimonadales bacterium]